MFFFQKLRQNFNHKQIKKIQILKITISGASQSEKNIKGMNAVGLDSNLVAKCKKSVVKLKSFLVFKDDPN